MPTPVRLTPPNLPSAPGQYNPGHENNLLSILRMFFNQLTNSINLPHSYGFFYQSATQTNPVANIAHPIQLNIISTAYNATIIAPLSRIYPNETGIYRVTCMAQANLSSGTPGLVTFWVSKNGTPIPGTGFNTNLASTTNLTVISKDYILPLLSTDYIELYWSSSDTSAVLQATAATATMPLIPSASVSINYLTQALV